MTAETILLVDEAAEWMAPLPSQRLVPVKDYLTGRRWHDVRRLRVVNLSARTRYHGPGYYASLLAEARGHRVMPSVRTLQDLSSRTLYATDLEVLERDLDRMMSRLGPPGDRDRYELSVFFGVGAAEPLQPLARAVFESFRAPILRVKLRRTGGWRIESVALRGPASLEGGERTLFLEALRGALGRPLRRARTRRSARYDLAILHDPEEALPPSNRRALARFIRAARSMGVDAELITRRDLAWLAEYDALFIRETTAVNHHTYRFARRAAAEGLVVMDDPDSILRCTNKIYLAELLERKHIPAPRSVILTPDDLGRAGEELGYPMVLKVPDGSFSRGVFRIEDREELERRAGRLFPRSGLLLAQAYTFTPFDWRIGILAGEPLYACRYHMSRGHWQILDHGRRGAPREGAVDTVPLDDVPGAVLRAAVRAGRAVGDGLYGVDLKEVGDAVLVIEVNDNPNVDAGVEDRVLGRVLYERIMGEFARRLEFRTRGHPGTGGESSDLPGRAPGGTQPGGEGS